MNTEPIKTLGDYNRALERLEVIFDAKEGSNTSDELLVLVLLIESYENEHFPISLS